jgi:hypothetical protein
VNASREEVAGSCDYEVRARDSAPGGSWSERLPVHVLEFRPGAAPAWRVWPVHLSESEARERQRVDAGAVPASGSGAGAGESGSVSSAFVREHRALSVSSDVAASCRVFRVVICEACGWQAERGAKAALAQQELGL